MSEEKRKEVKTALARIKKIRALEIRNGHLCIWISLDETENSGQNQLVK